ncbi:DUF1830 domain-containing protein [Spirulina subsalsa FACHB-351]|uniref:DUF1830 domain-containing protein n=1 Tax=Spirulina subsalsa FACHB-351 TaxID=234711 RepID=A0ABT3L9B7_9CYAN|nr:DUF1830 domain-containing protein [Spirulina subsalsa]MCW6038057.1 DUF1830 domain-containing protein [Spirulina subsalsa FACHB-351]
MAQIFDPIPNNAQKVLLCCYVNATSQIQIARITNIPNWYFERVVFPGQRLVFEAVPSSLLEIHTGMMASAILSDTIPCERLRIDDDQDGMILDDSVLEPTQDIPDTIHARSSTPLAVATC